MILRAIMCLVAFVSLVYFVTGCSLSYVVTQSHGSGEDLIEEDQKTDATPQLTIPKLLSSDTIHT